MYDIRSAADQYVLKKSETNEYSKIIFQGPRHDAEKLYAMSNST